VKVIVIGGGILGASTAYHLVRLGADVTVIDRADDGRATAAGAGIICPWLSASSDPAYYPIARAAGAYYSQLVADLAADGEAEVGYRRVGSLVIPEDSAELDAVEQRLASRRAEAPEMGVVQRLAPAQAVALFPPLRRDRPAVHIAGTARVNGRLLAAAMLRAVQRRGGTVMEGAEAALDCRDGGIAGVRAGDAPIAADAVVAAAGAWAPSLLRPLGIRLDVFPQRGQIVHLRMRDMDTRAWPVLQPMNDFYLLAFDDSRIVVGATRESRTGFDYRATAGGMAAVLNVGLTVAPGLAAAEIIETRIGFRPMAFDNRPMIGAIAGVAGLFVGNGLGPSGLTIGPYAGRLLAAAVLGEKPALDISAYAPLRGQPAAEAVVTAKRRG
jgi:D-amino-acid dehydrogenase